jgi:predicted DNA-binding transcriptional regulator AlpA
MKNDKRLERLLAVDLRPRLLSREEAAHYVGLSPNAFEQEVAAGTFPKAYPLAAVRRRLWDIRAIDAALDHLLGPRSNDWEARKRAWQEQRPKRSWTEREAREREERQRLRSERRAQK